MSDIDTVRFTCPHCKSELLVETDDGLANGNAYDAKAAPISIAKALDGTVHRCKVCAEDVLLKALPSTGIPTRLPMEAVKP